MPQMQRKFSLVMLCRKHSSIPSSKLRSNFDTRRFFFISIKYSLDIRGKKLTTVLGETYEEQYQQLYKVRSDSIAGQTQTAPLIYEMYPQILNLNIFVKIGITTSTKVLLQ